MICYQCMRSMQGDQCMHCGFSLREYQPVPDALRPESILAGKYQVGRVLGRGGFGITYIGKIMESGKVVAIKEFFPVVFATRDSVKNRILKVYPREQENFNKGVRRFYEEAETLSRLHGIPEIVQVFDFFYENETAYIVMEYIKGQTVEELVKQQGPLDLAMVLTIFYPVMRALQIVHQHGMLHRDVSPCNIILDDHFHPHLIDFGAARAFSSQLSSDMSVILKKGFAPVEQYMQHGRHSRCEDVYALSASIYYALTGKIPPAATDRAIFDTLKPLHDFNVHMPPLFEQILLKGMAVQRTDRYASMDLMCQAIDQIFSIAVPKIPEKERKPETIAYSSESSLSKPRRPVQCMKPTAGWLTALVGLLVLIGMVLVLWITR